MAQYICTTGICQSCQFFHIGISKYSNYQCDMWKYMLIL